MAPEDDYVNRGSFNNGGASAEDTPMDEGQGLAHQDGASDDGGCLRDNPWYPEDDDWRLPSAPEDGYGLDDGPGEDVWNEYDDEGQNEPVYDNPTRKEHHPDLDGA